MTLPKASLTSFVMRSQSDFKTVLVTGGSSGIGKAACRAFSKKGLTVYEFSRSNPPEGEREAVHCSVDVTDEEEVRRAVSDILKKEGAIDILVNCAGFGIGGAAEFTDTEDAKRQFDVNFFGTARVTKAVLESMHKRGRGRIVNISSVAAVVPIPFQAYYSASKAAVNSYTAALANEVRPYGISVCAVQPGDVSSGFTAARKKTYEGDELYGGRIAKSLSKMEKDETEGMPGDVCGSYIAKIALKKKIRPYYTAGFGYKLICVLAKLLPRRFVNRILYYMYAA